MKAVRCVWVCIMAVLAGCSEPEPIRLGLIAGLSGKHADLGTECRNGVQLAVEEQNARGGIQGSALILLARDDHSSAAEASKQVAQLDEQERVMALLGPALSGVAVGILEDINRRRLVTMGLTTTSNQLSDKDDFYFRIISPTRQHASVSARYMRQRAQVFDYVAIYDVTNRAYTESWLNDFSRTFVQSGGHEVARLAYDGDRDKVRELVTRANAHGADLVVLVTGATDAALMIKEIRAARPDQTVMTSEWAATPTFVGL
ncbi:MAG: amino acid ABC transporter substrate-binding protein, partial [Gammaproteobacteria bacterium]